jgi:hypothetical protein
MIDLILVGIIALVAWLVASEGAHGAAVTFVATLLSGLLATNFFEPLATFLAGMLRDYDHYMDLIAFLGVFAICVTLLRVLAEQLQPTQLELYGTIYEPLRWASAVGTGYIVMALVAVSLHLAPMGRDFLGFTPERKNLFGMSPDRQWLGFSQYVSEKSLRCGRVFDAPVYQAPGTTAERVWSSFPIRYASRRSMLDAGGMAGAAPAPAPNPAPAGGAGPAPGGGPAQGAPF